MEVEEQTGALLPSDLSLTPAVIIGVIGERLFAISLSHCRGVAPAGRVTPIPGAPAAIAGLVYFRGGIEAAVDLRVVWGDPPSPPGHDARAVLIEAEGMRAVLLVDHLLDLFDAPQSALTSGNGSNPPYPPFNRRGGFILPFNRRGEHSGSAEALVGVAGHILWNDRDVALLSAARLLHHLSIAPITPPSVEGEDSSTPPTPPSIEGGDSSLKD